MEMNLWNDNQVVCSPEVWQRTWSFMMDTIWDQVSNEVWGFVCDAVLTKE